MIDSVNPDIIVDVEIKKASSVHIDETLPKKFLENVVRADRNRGGGAMGVLSLQLKMNLFAAKSLNYIPSVKFPG